MPTRIHTTTESLLGENTLGNLTVIGSISASGQLLVLHKSTHATGGSDPLAPADIGIPDTQQVYQRLALNITGSNSPLGNPSNYNLNFIGFYKQRGEYRQDGQLGNSASLLFFHDDGQWVIQDSGGLVYLTLAGFESRDPVLNLPTTGWVVDSTGLPLSGSVTFTNLLPTEYEDFIVACSDENTNLVTESPKLTFRMPYAMNLQSIRASVNTASVGSNIIVDVNQNNSSIFSTRLSIDAGEKTSLTAATSAVLSTTTLSDDAEITIDIDQVGSTTAGKGLKLVFKGFRL